jgi:hypothetical protein
MIPFEAYSEQQRSNIVDYLTSVMDEDATFFTWNGSDQFVPNSASPEDMDQLTIEGIYEIQVLNRELHLNRIINLLEDYARSYREDIARAQISKTHLKDVAVLCKKLAKLLPIFQSQPHLLGLGVDRNLWTIDGHTTFFWDLADPKWLDVGLDIGKGNNDLFELIERLRSIVTAISNSSVSIPASASKMPRNKYLLNVLTTWLLAGGVIGGPNSAMTLFLREACIPVLGKHFPTAGALVKLAYNHPRINPKKWRRLPTKHFKRLEL